MKSEVHDTGTDKQRNKVCWLSRSDVCRATVRVVTLFVCSSERSTNVSYQWMYSVLRSSRVSSWMEEWMAIENRKLPGKWEMLLSLASQACRPTRLSDGETQITTWNDSAMLFYDTFYGRDLRVKNYDSMEASNSSSIPETEVSLWSRFRHCARSWARRIHFSQNRIILFKKKM